MTSGCPTDNHSRTSGCHTGNHSMTSGCPTGNHSTETFLFIVDNGNLKENWIAFWYTIHGFCELNLASVDVIICFFPVTYSICIALLKRNYFVICTVLQCVLCNAGLRPLSRSSPTYSSRWCWTQPGRLTTAATRARRCKRIQTA